MSRHSGDDSHDANWSRRRFLATSLGAGSALVIVSPLIMETSGTTGLAADELTDATVAVGSLRSRPGHDIEIAAFLPMLSQGSRRVRGLLVRSPNGERDGLATVVGDFSIDLVDGRGSTLTPAPVLELNRTERAAEGVLLAAAFIADDQPVGVFSPLHETVVSRFVWGL